MEYGRDEKKKCSIVHQGYRKASRPLCRSKTARHGSDAGNRYDDVRYLW